MKSLKSKIKKEPFLLVAIAVLSLPAILTQTGYVVFDFSNLGQVGDTIGGITSPFVGLLSAYLIYKAFIIQVEANKIQSRNHEFGIALKLIDDLKDELTAKNKRYQPRGDNKEEIFNANYDEIIRFWNEMKTYKDDYTWKIIQLTKQIKYFESFVQNSKNLSLVEKSKLFEKASLAFGSDLTKPVEALLNTETSDITSDDKFYSFMRRFRETTLENLSFHSIDINDFEDQ